jgi:hypothetical protein
MESNVNLGKAKQSTLQCMQKNVNGSMGVVLKSTIQRQTAVSNMNINEHEIQFC